MTLAKIVALHNATIMDCEDANGMSVPRKWKSSSGKYLKDVDFGIINSNYVPKLLTQLRTSPHKGR